MMRRRALLVLGLVLAASTAASAQSPVRSRAFLGLGLGAGVGGSVADVGAAVAELAYQRGPHQLSLRAAGLFDPFGDAADVAGELGLLYGRVADFPFGYASLAAGLAFTGFDACESSQDSCFGAGVPVVAEVALLAAPFLGVGLEAFANLNAEATYGGLALVAHLGRLR